MPYKMESSNKELYYTAIHEAGHLITELHFSQNKVKTVSIVSNGSSYGRVVMQLKKEIYKRLEIGPLSAVEERYFKRNFIISVAGPLAECRYRKINDFGKVGAFKDMDDVCDILFELYPSNKVAEAYLNYIIEEGRDFGSRKRNWDLIKKMAKLLLNKKELNRKQILSFYRTNFYP